MGIFADANIGGVWQLQFAYIKQVAAHGGQSKPDNRVVWTRAQAHWRLTVTCDLLTLNLYIWDLVRQTTERWFLQFMWSRCQGVISTNV